MTNSQPFPPTARDFLAYERIVADGASTRQVAEELKISQTRVRQLVRRVADWLAENLPAHDETRQAAQLRLAQNIAADRLHRYLREAEDAWRQTHESKYFTAILRIITAFTKLPAQPFTLAALAADAMEQQPTWESEAPAEPNSITANLSPTPHSELPTSPSELRTSSSISNPKSEIPNSHPAPSSFSTHPSSFPAPPIRACSPTPILKQTNDQKSADANQLTSSPTTSSDSTPDAKTAVRKSFLSPAQPTIHDAPSGAISQLRITAKAVNLNSTKNHSTRRDRRRLQRLLTQK